MTTRAPREIRVNERMRLKVFPNGVIVVAVQQRMAKDERFFPRFAALDKKEARRLRDWLDRYLAWEESNGTKPQKARARIREAKE